MKKIVLSVIAALSLLIPALISLRSASATTCGVQMPETLLSLYRGSDTIYIGNYRGSEVGPVTHDDDDYREIEIRKHFEISSVLKGKPVKAYTLVDSDVQPKDKNEGFETAEQAQQAQQAQFVSETSIQDFEDFDAAASKELKPGDDVLLFLRNDEDGKQLELTDYRDGLKRLPSKDIAVYEARIKELASIFAAEKPDAEKITDWLVTCAEDEATRWEGTYELERSFDALEYKTQRDAERKEKAANGAEVEDEDLYFNEGFETGRTIIFARLLNTHQKQTLANIMLNGEFQGAPKRPGDDGFVRGDSELMSLVSRWADSRIAELLITKLRSGAYGLRENSDLMDRISSMLGDDQLSSLAGKFSNTYYERDETKVEESDIDDLREMTAAEEQETDETVAEKADEPVDEAVAPETVPAAVTSDAPAVKPLPQTPVNEEQAKAVQRSSTLTYREFRDQLIFKFLERVDRVMADPETRILEKK